MQLEWRVFPSLLQALSRNGADMWAESEMMITRSTDGGVSESRNEAEAAWMVDESALHALNLSERSIYAVAGCRSARAAAAGRHIK